MSRLVIGYSVPEKGILMKQFGNSCAVFDHTRQGHTAAVCHRVRNPTTTSLGFSANAVKALVFNLTRKDYFNLLYA